MPRQLRREYAGAVYHVMNRGDRREPIFRDGADRRLFLAALTEACGKTQWQIHAYCLMRNHFHLVLRNNRAQVIALQYELNYFLSVVGDSACLDDSLQTNTPPAGSWQYDSLEVFSN